MTRHRASRPAAARALLTAAVLGVVLAACGGDDAVPTSAAPAAPAVEPTLRIVATVSPLADLVAQVGGERVEVRPLVPAGADAHTYAPRPGDARRIERADLYIGIGLALNDDALRLARTNVRPEARLVLLGEEFLDTTGFVFDHAVGDRIDLPVDAAGLGPNPHVWTSLTNARALVRGIVTVLTDADPAGAEVYAHRGALLDTALAELFTRVDAAVATIAPADRVLVTYHDAWVYFARDHGLDHAIAVQAGDFSDPSAAGVRSLIDQVRALGVRAVFGSRVFPSAVLEVIAAESGATYVPGLSDDALPGEAGTPEHTYLELMRQNAVIIVEGLGGDASGLAVPIPPVAPLR
jgi:ABC-type Zn uptake system ZnuABC Zn-binding protein ZnuA